MTKGYCFTKARSNGSKYVVCPGYFPAPKVGNVNLRLENSQINRLLRELEAGGFQKKHTKKIARLMLKWGRGMNEFSKTGPRAGMIKTKFLKKK